MKSFQEYFFFVVFEKAFDSVEWNFISKALELLNFGPVEKNDVESAVMNAGFLSNYFKVSRGVRQGCPLSPLLFILIRNDLEIHETRNISDKN